MHRIGHLNLGRAVSRTKFETSAQNVDDWLFVEHSLLEAAPRCISLGGPALTSIGSRTQLKKRGHP
jgi:hypothetical protein